MGEGGLENEPNPSTSLSLRNRATGTSKRVVMRAQVKDYRVIAILQPSLSDTNNVKAVFNEVFTEGGGFVCNRTCIEEADIDGAGDLPEGLQPNIISMPIEIT